MFNFNKIICSCLVIAVFFSGNADADDPYEFDWNSSKDMSGAFFMCGLTAFTWTDGANCPKVLLKCLTDPGLLKWTWKGPKSKCLNLSSFFTSGDQAIETLMEAARRTETEIDDLAISDFAEHVEGVENTIEQEPKPDGSDWDGYIEGSYSDTVYMYAELATSTFADSDYFDFYYTGDGEGNGGWGHPDFQRDHFEDDIYVGTSAAQAYEDGYDSAYVEPNYTDYVSYEPTPDELIDITESMSETEIVEAEAHNEEITAFYVNQTNTENDAIDDANRVLHSNSIAAAIDGAIIAKNLQQNVINNEYDTWRTGQVWDSFGYKIDAFEKDYNLARTQAFYSVFIEAGSVVGCDLACATVAAESAADKHDVSG